ncbi:MAG: HAMP domain-containing histidine kinase [Acidimicrobiia bacterium]|nr:HAMP domain-containing histidine kinase [Acidimicrobiia bacterium]
MTTTIRAVIVVGVGLLVTELVMTPTWPDRWALLSIYAGAAAATLFVSWFLRRFYLPRVVALRTSVIVVAVAAVSVAAVSVALSSGFMFFSPHDLRLLGVSLALGAGLAVVMSIAVTRPLADDLEVLAATAERVANGDLDTGTEVGRRDEVGAVARAMDTMVHRLRDNETARSRAEEARRHFLAAVSHDLRTPLASMQAAVEALEDGMVDDPARYYRVMHGDLELLGSLVDDLFLMTRIEAGDAALEHEPIDLAELADEAVEAMMPVAARRRIQLKLESPPGVKAVGSPNELGRVIRNLLDNAIRHAPPESTVSVTVANGSGASVTVTDAGGGFAADFIDVAFDSFTRDDPARTRAAGGAGLGLAIAKGVVDAHGGRIWAEAGPGGRVRFEIPAG